jgi:hypothetical protein
LSKLTNIGSHKVISDPGKTCYFCWEWQKNEVLSLK